MKVCNPPRFIIPPMTRINLFMPFVCWIGIYVRKLTRQHSLYKMWLTLITENESSWKSLGIEVYSVFIVMTSFLLVSNSSITSKLLVATMLQWSSKIDGVLSKNMTYVSLESMLGLKANLKAISSILLTYDYLDWLFLSYMLRDVFWKQLLA